MVLMNDRIDLTSYQVEKPLVKHFLYSDATMFNMIDSGFDSSLFVRLIRIIKHILKHIMLAHQLW